MQRKIADDIYYQIGDAILNEEFTGFKEDYLVVHSLIRLFRPKSLFEIGTNMGTGTNILCNAGKEWDMKVYSLDLPTELAHISLQHPISEGKGDKVGSMCKFPYTQLRGDSIGFDYSQYPCEAFYIDGEHDTDHVHIETVKAVTEGNANLIIYHDADIPAVYDGIFIAFKGLMKMGVKFARYRVVDTRILFAVRRDSDWYRGREKEIKKIHPQFFTLRGGIAQPEKYLNYEK